MLGSSFIHQHVYQHVYKQHVTILLCLSDSVRCRRGYYFLAWVVISTLAHIRMLILNNYVLLEDINTTYKYGHTWVI